MGETMQMALGYLFGLHHELVDCYEISISQMAWVFLPLLRRFCHSFIANKTSIWLYCTSNTAYVLSDSELFTLLQAHRFTPCFGVFRVFICLAFCVVLLFWFVFILNRVPNVSSVSELSILDCHFSFLCHLFNILKAK
jgi:hypothetical protein